MYKLAKSLAFKILPSKLIMSQELRLRRILSMAYRGEKHECSVCESKLSSFPKVQTGQICPVCGSLERTRLLTKLLSLDFSRDKLRVLHFSPHQSLSKKLGAFYQHYSSSDFQNPKMDYQFDIQKISIESESYDLIICFHVLEHIPDDRKAISELYRVLAKNGTALIQVPFKEGETIEDPSISDPKKRLELFGQEDHVRYYSLDGLTQRLNKSGFQCEIVQTVDLLNEKQTQRLGINKDQIIVKAVKN